MPRNCRCWPNAAARWRSNWPRGEARPIRPMPARCSTPPASMRGADLTLARQQSARAMAIGLANRATLLQARAAAQMSALDDGTHAIFLGKQAVNALQAARENHRL